MGWTFYDSSGRKLNTASTLIDNLDIDGATDIGAAIVDADLFIIDDGAGGTNRKTAASRLKTYAGVTQAVQSDVKAETNQDTYVPPDLLSKAPSSVKAHCSIASGGTLSSGDYNVAGVDDDSTGNRDVNFTVAFADAAYTHLFINRDNAAVAAGFDLQDLSTGTCGWISYNCESNAAADYSQEFVAMGDQ